MRVIYSILAVLALASAKSLDECSQGESYWCSDLRIAKQCGAVSHCMDTVWMFQVPREAKGEQGEICDYCENFVAEVRQIISDNATQAQVEQFLLKACGLIPLPEIAQQCTEMMKQNVPEIFQMLESKLDPKAVCSALGLCPAFLDLPRQAKNDLEHAKQVLRETALYKHGYQDQGVCDCCKNFIASVRDVITKNATVQQVTDYLDKACAAISVQQIAEDCKELVAKNIPELFELIKSELNPDEICKCVGLCPSLQNALIELPRVKLETAKLRLRQSPLFQQLQVPRLGSILECDLCKMTLTELQNLDRDKGVQDDVKNFIKESLCSRLPTLKDACDTTVDEFGTELFELLVTELDPNTRCVSLGFCQMNGEPTIPKHETQKPVNKEDNPKPVPKVKSSATCIICKFVITEVDKILGNNRSEPAIEDALDKVCKLLPSSVSLECQEFVNTFTAELVQILKEELDPAVVCSAIGACNAAKTEPPKRTPQVKSSTECVICKFVITELDNLLGNNRSEPAIESALDKVCQLLPKSLESECEEFVNTYTPVLVQILAKELDPDVVCATIGMCSSKIASHKVGDGEVCGICETVIQYLDSVLELNSTQQMMEAALEKVCSLGPAALKTQCDDFVKLYGPTVIELIAQYADPREICNDLKLCSYNLAKEEPIVPKKAVLVGENECTYGPAFWCQNMDNAKKCNAVPHCKKHVWKN